MTTAIMQIPIKGHYLDFDRMHGLYIGYTGKVMRLGHCSLSERRGKNSCSDPLYSTWEGMIARCTNPNATGYENYGGRGVRVCWSWLNSPSQFFEDMGAKPSPKHQLDRIDNDKGYSPENCRWVLPTVNAFNKRNFENSTGFRGVIKFRNKWQARMHIGRKQIYVGTFATAVEAYQEYIINCKEWYGFVPQEMEIL